jgi:hypothetical protein
LFLRRLQAELDNITGKDVEEWIIDIETQMLEMRKPNIWNVHEPGNMEMAMEVDFEKLLVAVSEFTSEKIDELSIFRFYALIDYLEEKHKPKNKKA